jgi:mRNA interferase RelE/StbE
MPIPVQDRIDKTLMRIKVRPYDFIERMVNYPFYKLRVGKYRLILEVRDQDLIILIVERGHRRNIYKRLKL